MPRTAIDNLIAKRLDLESSIPGISVGSEQVLGIKPQAGLCIMSSLRFYSCILVGWFVGLFFFFFFAFEIVRYLSFGGWARDGKLPNRLCSCMTTVQILPLTDETSWWVKCKQICLENDRFDKLSHEPRMLFHCFFEPKSFRSHSKLFFF